MSLNDKKKQRKKNKTKKKNKDNKTIKVNKINIFKRLYLSYNKRLTLLIILFIFLGIYSVILFSKTVNYVDLEDVNYYEKSNLDYKVYLKENNFYEKDYLDKDMLYVASLIDYISVDFNYNFEVDQNIDLDSTYKIVGKLVITDLSGNNIFFEKEYDLLDEQTINIQNDNNYSIKENLNIDYGYYNNLANSFRTLYGVDTKSNLIIYLKINNKTSESEKVLVLSEKREMNLIIPLSEKSITIKMNYKEINDFNKIIKNSEYVFNKNISLLVKMIIFVSLAAIVLFIIIKLLLLLLNVKKSSYDKKVKKILNEYDRLIAETEFFPNLDEYTVIKINKFEELLDIRDNLKLPIMYFNVATHHKCHLYIMDKDKIYLHTIKSTDLEGKYEKK